MGWACDVEEGPPEAPQKPVPTPARVPRWPERPWWGASAARQFEPSSPPAAGPKTRIPQSTTARAPLGSSQVTGEWKEGSNVAGGDWIVIVYQGDVGMVKPWGWERQRNRREERYIRVVISERGTGISFNAMQYFSKYKNTEVQKSGLPGTMSPKPMVVKVMKQK